MESLQSASNGIGPTGDIVKYAWIGATDDPDQNGSIWDSENNTTTIIDINATAGDWKWLAGTTTSTGMVSSLDVHDSGYSNWVGGIEPNSTDKDYAALDFEGSEGNWSDFNGSYRLPFIIEHDTVPEPATLSTPIDGYRKVLVIPARFQDEGYTYMGSSAPFVDEFGNVLYPDLQKESFEPVSQANLAQAMQEVKEFYHRNSDGTFHLEPVICPTVTIPYEKFTQLDNRGHPITPNGPNIFDSEGNIFGFANHPQWNSENRGDLGFFREDMQFQTISDDDSLTTVALKKAIQEEMIGIFGDPPLGGSLK